MQQQPVTVLIVDDEPQARELVGEMLEREGFGVLEAGDGATAVRLAAERRPDLVLLDLVMPGMNGFEVAAGLRRNPATADIPVLVLTAADLSEEDKQVLNGQVRAVLRKGAHQRMEVLSCVNETLGRLGLRGVGTPAAR